MVRQKALRERVWHLRNWSRAAESAANELLSLREGRRPRDLWATKLFVVWMEPLERALWSPEDMDVFRFAMAEAGLTERGRFMPRTSVPSLARMMNGWLYYLTEHHDLDLHLLPPEMFLRSFSRHMLESAVELQLHLELS